MPLMRTIVGTALVGILPAVAVAQPCLTLAGRVPSTPVSVIVDVPVEFALTAAGKRAAGDLRLVYLEITRRSVAGDQPLPFRRLLDGGNQSGAFTFSRKANYEARVLGASSFAWPDLTGGTPKELACDVVQIVSNDPTMPVREFEGVRAHLWAAYRPLKHGELGGSVFFRRLGLAILVDAKPPSLFKDDDEGPDLNLVTVAAEVRWRGARGYLGGSVRYFPDEEPGKDPFRVGFVAAEELPSFKGKPIWLFAEIRADKAQWNIFEELSFSAGVRFDLAGIGK